MTKPPWSNLDLPLDRPPPRNSGRDGLRERRLLYGTPDQVALSSDVGVRLRPGNERDRRTSVRTAFVQAVLKAAEQDERIVLLTGDLGFMALEPFRDRFPDRFYNMGVAEQNMVGVATGLADAGFVPFCYSIVPFAVLRPYEFIRNGPVLHDLPVRIVGMGGGFEYGSAGPSHYGIEDVGAMRLLQGMAVIAPADAAQAATAVKALGHWPGPAYLRLGKNDRLQVPGLDGRFELGRAQQVREGTNIVLFAMGSVAESVVAAADELEREGISATVVVIASVSPSPYCRPHPARIGAYDGGHR